jgi:nucleoside-diphosphate-sugar epimerase
MNILITGASGLIGRNLAESLKGTNQVYCQSRKHHGKVDGLNWIKHDLVNDSWESLDLPEIDIVYHLAAQTSVYKAKENPLEDLFSNVVAFLRLLEFFKINSHSPFIVLTGTATQVGLVEQLPINEQFIDKPITFYDIGKLTAELYLLQYIKEGWLRGCSLRLANVFGRGTSVSSEDRSVLDRIFRQAIAGQEISIYGDGNYIRDYIYIDDVVSSLIAAPESPENTNGRTFYIGTGTGVSLRDAIVKVIALAATITGSIATFKHVSPPANLSEIEFRNAIIDSGAFAKATGWAPKYDFDSGLSASCKGVMSVRL